MNGDCIARSKICDGVFDCTDGSDENGCRSGRCEPNEFQCSNRKCVLKTWRCGKPQLNFIIHKFTSVTNDIRNIKSKS